jgi:hypothetical protein
MYTFQEANQARIALKMKLCNYYWYNSCDVIPFEDKYYIGVSTKFFTLKVKNKVPSFIKGFQVKVFSD